MSDPIPEDWKPGMALASALMAAGYPGDSGEDVDRLIAELAKRGHAVIPHDGCVCPACGLSWWTVGDDGYGCDHGKRAQPAPDDAAALAAALRDDDAAKLNTLATWFDRFDDWREATNKIAPGIAEYREVQADLRRIAAALPVHPPAPLPLDVERLAEALHEWGCISPITGKPKRRRGGHERIDRQEAEAIAAIYARLATPEPTEVEQA